MNQDSAVAVRGGVGRSYRLLTLDVFDTCLIRDYISQESLWYQLGQRIAADFPGISGAADFVRLREEAEERARDLGACEDITLPDVYRHLASAVGWDAGQRDRAAALEEEAEAVGLRLNPAARSLITQAQDAVVCYLTDTPHRGAFIRSCLDGQSLPPGPVLSSGDLGLRKGTGHCSARR